MTSLFDERIKSYYVTLNHRSSRDAVYDGHVHLAQGAIWRDSHDLLPDSRCSVPVSLALTRGGFTESLLEAGAVIKPSF